MTMKSFAVAVLSLSSTMTVWARESRILRMGSKGSTSTPTASPPYDSSQQKLFCKSFEPPSTAAPTKGKGGGRGMMSGDKSKGKGSASATAMDPLLNDEVEDCPCCNAETCIHFMENEFCSAPGFDLFDVTSPDACLYTTEGTVDDMFGSLVGINLLEFGEDNCFNSGGYSRRLIDSKSKFIPGSFAFCCEELDMCHTDPAIAGCCDQQRRTRRMNEMSATHDRVVTKTPEGGLHTVTRADNKEGLDWLHGHIEEMHNRMETGDTARTWDPLFKAYFDNAKEIELKCEHSANKVECKSHSQTQCGKDLIQAHAAYHQKIAESIRNGEGHIIVEEHLVPESCL